MKCCLLRTEAVEKNLILEMFLQIHSFLDFQGPFVLLLNDSSSVECDNISVNLTEMDQIINKRLCKFKPEETRSFRQVMNRHWNSSINKELVRSAIENGV